MKYLIYVNVQNFVESLNLSNLEKGKRDKLKKEYQDILKQLKSKCHEEANVSPLNEEIEIPEVASSNKQFPGRINVCNVQKIVIYK